jgi:FkbM family methyltransferase
MSPKSALKALFRGLGYEIRIARLPRGLERRRKLMSAAGIDLVLDVGANAGQYATKLRSLGYRGRIVSFEPMAEPFRRLQERATADPSWECVNYAIGETNGSATINVSENSVSSSLRPILDACVAAAPAARYVGRETVEVRRLDDVFADFVRGDENVLLKIDTQGFEREVLAGARRSLGRIRMLQIEASLRPLYAGESLMCDLVAQLGGAAFELASIEDGFEDAATGRLLQVDLVFVRRAA